MFDFFKKPKVNASTEALARPTETPALSFWQRLQQGLSKTRQSLQGGLAKLLTRPVDAALLEELETVLLSHDVGLDATEAILTQLKRVRFDSSQPEPGLLKEQLRALLLAILKPIARPFVLQSDKPQVILIVGVNGAGKTTTIGKLARWFQAQNASVLLGAADTFRAAASEQLIAWGARNNVPVVHKPPKSDSAAVAFEALEIAKAQGKDLLLIDTAGRLHTQVTLMDELKKMVRVLKKSEAAAPHETWLVLDAGIGQNAIQQVKQFQASIPLTGLILSKLDGSARGGVVFALAKELMLPIIFIGLGEAAEDLRPFDAESFVDALLNA